MLEDGALRLRSLDVTDMLPIRALMREDEDLPMDFAAALVRVTEREQIHTSSQPTAGISRSSARNQAIQAAPLQFGRFPPSLRHSG